MRDCPNEDRMLALLEGALAQEEAESERVVRGGVLIRLVSFRAESVAIDREDFRGMNTAPSSTRVEGSHVHRHLVLAAPATHTRNSPPLVGSRLRPITHMSHTHISHPHISHR